MKVKFLENKKKFQPYHGKINDFNRLSIIHVLIAFVIIPCASVLLYFSGIDVVYLYFLLSYSVFLPIYLFICWKIKFLNNKVLTLYIIHAFVGTFLYFYLNYEYLMQTDKLLYFLSIFVVAVITIQRWKWLLLYCIFSLSLLIFELSYFDVILTNNTIIYQLFFLVSVITLTIAYYKERYIEKNEDYIHYLKSVMNGTKTGFLILSKDTLEFIDCNDEALNFFSTKDRNTIEIKEKLLFILKNEGIQQLKELSNRNKTKLSKDYTKTENGLTCHYQLGFRIIQLKKENLILLTIIDSTDLVDKNDLLKINDRKYQNLYSKNKSGVFTLNRSSVVLDCNNAFLQILEETIGIEDRLFGDLNQNQWDLILASFDELESVQNYQTQLVLKNGKEKMLNFSWYFDKQTNLIEGSVVDLTSIQEANQALKQSEEKFRLIYEETNDAILLVLDDEIINVNRKAIKLFGKSEEDLVSTNTFELSSDTSEYNRKVYNSYKEQLKSKRAIKFNWNFSGIAKTIESEITVIEIILGNQLFYQYVIHDNTNQNEVLRSIEKSRTSLQNVLENNPEGIIITNNNQVVYSNPAIKKLLGNDWTISNLFIEEDQITFNQAMERCSKNLEKSNLQIQLEVSATKTLAIDAMIVPTLFEEQESVLLILKDITDQTQLAQEKVRIELVEKSNKDLSKEINERINAEKLLEEQYLRTKAILDSSSNTFLVTLNRDNVVTSFNKHSYEYFAEYFGINLKNGEMFSVLFQKIISPAELRLVQLKFNNVKIGHSKQLEIKLSNNNKDYWLEIFMNPIYDTSGNVTEISIVSHDKTDKKLASIEIQESLKQKEILLKEVHHRVKNNLQVISSILSLQSSFVEDEEMLNILRESQNRVRSMSDIHEHLYQSEDFSKINFSNYIKKLGSNLIETYRTNTKVILSLELEEVEIGLDQAIPCGLLVNEIISNSLKYAWKDIGKGIFSIKLSENKESDEVTLELSDNGIGLPLEFSEMNSDTLGFQLIETLIEQLDATLSINIENGTKYLIKFVNLKI